MDRARPLASGNGQLPFEATAFVGRRSELRTLDALLSRSRLVTVTGPGGVGKTRLARHHAATAAARFKHGTALVELSGLRSPGLLPLAVSSALGLSQQDSRDPLTAVIGHLRNRETLLILDTCEHLIDECAQLANELLRGAPDVTILATSRQPLDVPGESTCPLAPLGVPEPGTDSAPGDAVELFAQRAAAAVPGFAVTEDNAEQVTGLCRRLEGIPLALELAAVRLRAFDLGELSRRLDRRFPLLSGGRRAAVPRHQALRDTIGWSYDLCTPAERTLWDRLSVFAGPFTMRAAEEICGGGELPRDAVVDTLISLVDKSVLHRAEGTVPCYRMLDTIREYGAERLDETGITDQVRARLLGYYLALAEEFDADPLTRQVDRYQVLHSQLGNVRAALGYGFDVPGQEDSLARLIAALYWFILVSGEFAEARVWLGRFLDRFRDASPQRASGLLLDGLLSTAQGADDRGLSHCAEGLSIAGESGDERLNARGHLYYCMALLISGRLETAMETGRLADKLLRAAGDAPNAEVLRLYLAAGHMLTGDLDRCLDDCAEALRVIPADDGERWVTSFLIALAGTAHFLRGETDRAITMVNRSLALRRELGDPMGMAFCLNLLGVLAAKQAKFRRAAWLMGSASRVWKTLGTRSLIGAESLTGFALAAIGQTRRAIGADTYEATIRDAGLRPLEDAAELAESGADDVASLGQRLSPDGSESPLTRREREIAALVAEGLSNRDIAQRLVISRRTVDSHVEHIFGKIGLSSRVQLAVWVRERAG